MKISSIITALFALAVVLFAGHALQDFKSTVADTADTATSQPVGAISNGFSAAWSLTDTNN